ncbi:HlyD family type I secretion periplasmic adaptor subunit [Azospirillum sp. TSH64]|uniref:HlyD family type I secretion periplasmic adaptor subunit n=1 Tax=Azospirillum sp. TSH64 TaxID=652740 RepID=UPI000D6077B8|nr:HlyD family type I secretion periplasmic adaptor subunit [Azospirillum sp. TSH64]PWC78124.1 secretion protein [Azospirillum sp. TSH64]
MAKSHSEQTINDFQSETAELTGAADPLAARLTVWLLATLVIVAVGLASVARLERVVSARGQVVSQSPTIVIQPLETSIVRSTLVREGQIVRKGDMLASLDPTFSAADVARFERQRDSLAAEIERLQMELDGKTYVERPGDADSMLQAAIWKARKTEYASSMVNFSQKQDAARATLARSRDDADHYKTRLRLISDIESMRRTLEENKTGSRLNSLLASDARVEASRNMAASESAIQSARHELEALQSEQEVYVQQWRSRIMQELVAKRVEHDRVSEEYAKAVKRHDLVEMRAVEDAVVLDVAPLSVGSVIQTAEKIMTLVPLNTALEVEAEIDAADQGFVKAGDIVQLKFDAYKYVEHGMGRGIVRTISEDSFTRRDGVGSGKPFYRARIELTDIKLHNVPSDFRLVPGMPLTTDIVVGSRTILSYLVEKAIVSISEGMREP